MFKQMTIIAGMLLAGSLTAQIAVKSNDKIAFLGDSITAQGNSFQAGYVNLVMAGLNANGIKAVKIPAGISGHKSNNMLDRLERDVLSKKPQIMLLSCGVNDVWHGKRGVPLPEYKKNIIAIVDRAQAAGIKVCILTATMIREDAKNAANTQLAAYNDFLRALAKEKNCLLADLNADMQQALAAFKAAHPKAKGNLLTVDGVHMNPLGNVMMAKGVLRTFGLTDAQLAKAEAAWENLAGNLGPVQLSVRDFRILSERAADAGMSVGDYIRQLIAKDVK
ncbi:MAG: hypothetical protein J5806_02075 [Lentisphaeria bacterium]|nr:hypothetical protein [Lentisphaeria bacterium]